jgi:fatty-acyl-CoA synthase
MISAGAVWTKEVRAGLVKHLPWITLCDNYGSSEALRGVQTYTRDGETPDTGVIAQSERLQLMGDDGRLVKEMSPGVSGAIVISGHLAVEYYKDPERTARTWRDIDGQRRCITGDYGKVEPDGTIRLLGRGASVVNTGGEKVYPPEVEEVLRQHETVSDAAVIGVPDERFGQAVTALIVPADGAEVEFSVLSQHVKRHLAGFKAPRHLLVVGTIPRTVTGKIDYAACASLADQHLESVPGSGRGGVAGTAGGTK